MEVRCRPISTFPPEFRASSQADPFSAGWSDTLWKLEQEVKKLGARSLVIELALKESEIRLDGWPYAEARPSHPGVIISFDSKHGPLRYGTDAFPHWQANVRAIALGLEKLRAIERYGIGKRGEQYQGWRQLSGGESMSPPDAEELLNSYGGEKAALKATHPDTGGSEEDFARVQLARQTLGLA
jgi:hypothetical protein